MDTEGLIRPEVAEVDVVEALLMPGVAIAEISLLRGWRAGAGQFDEEAGEISGDLDP